MKSTGSLVNVEVPLKAGEIRENCGILENNVVESWFSSIVMGQSCKIGRGG